MKITITGATGFIGSHIAEGLKNDGHDLILLVRDPGKLIPTLRDCRIVKGDILDEDSIVETLKGSEAVVHSAAYVGEWGPREAYFRANVDGTRNMIEACVTCSVKRFIHISSISVYGEGESDLVAVVEETPYNKTGHPYTDSKIEAERLIFAAHDDKKIIATAIRPGMVWGPRDRQFFPKIIDALSKGLMVYMAGGHKIVGLSHVDNNVEIARLCLAKKKSQGRAYNAADDDKRTYRDVVQAMCTRLGYREPWLSLPAGLAKFLGATSEFIWSAIGAKKSPLLTKMGVGLLCYDNDVSVERAKAELGFNPQDLFDQRLDAYLESYRAGE